MSFIKIILGMPSRIILTLGFISIYIIMLPFVRNRTELLIMTHNFVELVRSGKVL